MDTMREKHRIRQRLQAVDRRCTDIESIRHKMDEPVASRVWAMRTKDNACPS